MSNKINKEATGEIPARGLASLGVEHEGVAEYAEEVADDDGADEGLVAGWFERGCFRREEDEFDSGTHGKEYQ